MAPIDKLAFESKAVSAATWNACWILAPQHCRWQLTESYYCVAWAQLDNVRSPPRLNTVQLTRGVIVVGFTILVVYLTAFVKKAEVS